MAPHDAVLIGGWADCICSDESGFFWNVRLRSTAWTKNEKLAPSEAISFERADSCDTFFLQW